MSHSSYRYRKKIFFSFFFWWKWRNKNWNHLARRSLGSANSSSLLSIVIDSLIQDVNEKMGGKRVEFVWRLLRSTHNTDFFYRTVDFSQKKIKTFAYDARGKYSQFKIFFSSFVDVFWSNANERRLVWKFMRWLFKRYTIFHFFFFSISTLNLLAIRHHSTTHIHTVIYKSVRLKAEHFFVVLNCRWKFIAKNYDYFCNLNY